MCWIPSIGAKRYHAGARYESGVAREVVFPMGNGRISRTMPPVIHRYPADSRLRVAGFTLIELLAVVGLMLVLLTFLGPAIAGMKGAGDLTKAAYEIKGLLDQARAYAVANNTYVFVGFAEVSAAVNASVIPQTAGFGRIAAVVIASNDGTWSGAVSSGTIQVASVGVIGKLQRWENLHFAALADTALSGGMANRFKVDPCFEMGNTAWVQATSPVFYWPLQGTANQYAFKKVVVFDPQGVARNIVDPSATGAASMVSCFEIGLIPTNGATVSEKLPTNLAALQIDGVTGATRIFRP